MQIEICSNHILKTISTLLKTLLQETNGWACKQHFIIEDNKL